MNADQKNPSGGTRRILLVEDDADSAEMFTMLLEMEGYRVTWMSTARSVLQYFSAAGAAPSQGEPSSRADLMLLDLTLPDMDVPEMVRRLLEVGKAVPPIILMSAKSVRTVEAAASAIGAVGVVRKPFDLEELLREIESVLAPEA